MTPIGFNQVFRKCLKTIGLIYLYQVLVLQVMIRMSGNVIPYSFKVMLWFQTFPTAIYTIRRPIQATTVMDIVFIAIVNNSLELCVHGSNYVQFYLVV